MATAQEINQKVEALRAKQMRLEGQRDQIIKDLKALGHENMASVQAEIDQLEEFLRTAEPAYVAQYNKFLVDFGPALEAL